MEEKLAQEMSRMKIVDERKRREIEKICKESDELKELQGKITAAYLNKERTAQIAESQFRAHQQLVSIFHFEFLTVFSHYFYLTGGRCKYRHRVPAAKGKSWRRCPCRRFRETVAALRPQAWHPDSSNGPRGATCWSNARVHEGAG